MEFVSFINALLLALGELRLGGVAIYHDGAAFDLEGPGWLHDTSGVDVGVADLEHDERDTERFFIGFDDRRSILRGG
jgi:hypothetical protein